MNGAQPLRKKHQRQRGVAAIEFAIVFPVFFAVLYGIVQYGMIFAAQQTLTLAAEEGARAALQYQAADGTVPGSLSARTDVAETTCANMVGWVAQMSGVDSATICQATQVTTHCLSSMYCVQVTTTFPYESNPLIPNVGLPVPATVGSTATVQLDQASVI